MNIRKRALGTVLALVWVAGCKTSGGFDPIELDFSKKTSPTPAATALPATPTPVPVEAPVESRTVSPTPAPMITPAATQAAAASTPAPAVPEPGGPPSRSGT
ncbi:MAG: hypothetical protein LC796_13095, partial [Acidobacteria bacterium]|nr:hypothetical protein [Acidobacteriota bacterium]